MTHPLERVAGGPVPLDVAILFERDPRAAYRCARTMAPAPYRGRLRIESHNIPRLKGIESKPVKPEHRGYYWRAWRPHGYTSEYRLQTWLRAVDDPMWHRIGHLTLPEAQIHLLVMKQLSERPKLP